MPENGLPAVPEGASSPPLRGKHILVAAQAIERLRRILDGHDVVVALSMDHAKAQLQKRAFDLIVLGAHFDEPNLFELLRLVRTDTKNELTPVLCALVHASRLKDLATLALEHAVKALLADAFVNLQNFPDDEAGNARVRRIIDYLILIDGDMHGGLRAVHEKT